MSKRRNRAWRENRAQPIVTEDELRAREDDAEARVISQSEAAAEQLDAATRSLTPRNPWIIARELVHPMWMFSVVFFGLLAGGWSPASVIVCFWFEKLTRVSLMAARVYIHRKATRKRGHYRSQIDTYAGGPERNKHASFGRAWRQTVPRLFVLGEAGGKSTPSQQTKASGAATLLSQFVGMSVVVEVLTLVVIVWALSSMDDWTQSTSVWGFVR
jgi:hypothetical protein